MNMVEGRRDAGEPEVKHAGWIADRVACFVTPPVVGKRAARQESHHHERAAVVVAMVGDGHDVLVRHRQHCVDLTGKPLHRLRVLPDLPPRHLYDDRNPSLGVPCPVGHAHATNAQLRDQPVAAVNESSRGVARTRGRAFGRRHPPAHRVGAGVAMPGPKPKHFRDAGEIA